MRLDSLSTAGLWDVPQEIVNNLSFSIPVVEFFKIGIEYMMAANARVYETNTMLDLYISGEEKTISERTKTIAFYEERLRDITRTKVFETTNVSVMELSPAEWAGKRVRTLIDADGNYGTYKVLDDRFFALSFRHEGSGEVFLLPDETILEVLS